MTFDKWISPGNGEKLIFDGDATLSDGKNKFNMVNGIADLTYPLSLNSVDETARNFYEGRADDYEKYLHLTFSTYNEDEVEVRNRMIDLLDLKKDYKVLEVACGTGRDSLLIDSRLQGSSELHMTDISLDMLKTAKDKLISSNSRKVYCLSNAMHLPYPDNYFDAFYSFGAVGEFSDVARFFSEAVRVCKPGAKVVVGDENLPIWQRKSTFGKILSNYNKQFLEDVPFSDLPVEAREVRCQWVIGGVFYLMDFIVGEGEPYADFDFTIPGERGGTHKTRFYGQLEGVTEEAKSLAWQARELTGKSMHVWLDGLIKKEALKVIKNNQ